MTPPTVTPATNSPEGGAKREDQKGPNQVDGSTAAKAIVEILKEEKIEAFIATGLPGPFPNSRQDDPAIFRVLIVVGNKP